MEIEYIREFLTLAKYENYVVAADELFISQPSLTKHIKAVENELGYSLFDRTTRRVKLTKYGEAYLLYARQIITADSEARGALSMLEKDVRDTVHLGVLPAFIPYKVEEKMMQFRKEYPQYPITLTEGSNDALQRALHEGTCNLALIRTFEDPLPSSFVSVPYIRDHIVLVIRKDHPLNDGRTSITWKELEALDLLTSTSHLQSQMLEKICARENIHLNISGKMSRSNSIVEMLMKGVGDGAILHRIPTECYFKDMDIQILDITPSIYSTVSFVYMKNRPLTPAMRSFLQVVFPKGVEEGTFRD